MRLIDKMAMEPSDEELVVRARSGDSEAFGQLLGRHYDLIFRLAFRILGRKSEAEDLTQDICVAMPKKIQGFRGDAKFTTWLHRVTTNATRDRLRECATRHKAWGDWGELEQMNRATMSELREDLCWLREAMSTLSSELRQTVALVLGEGMTHALAAKVLEVSEGTISWRMSEVRRALRALAKEEERV